MFTQIQLRCPCLLKMQVTKNAVKSNFTIVSEEERTPVQGEALSVLDAETGKREIFCIALDKEKGACKHDYNNSCYYL